MKVQTDLKAGAGPTLANVVDQANSVVNTVGNNVGDFASTANEQAADLISSLTNQVSSFWNCVTGA